MLKLYFSSSVIWFIVIYSFSILIREARIKNGWIESDKKIRLDSVLLISLVPIYRFFVMLGLICQLVIEK